jgi:hypothetical protein
MLLAQLKVEWAGMARILWLGMARSGGIVPPTIMDENSNTVGS